MRICRLSTALALAVLALTGCADDNDAKQSTEPFEIEGPWLYLGPSDGPHTLTISRSSVVYAGVGADWSSTWSLKAYDNGLNHFQVKFDSGSGQYLPMGETLSATYDISGTFLTVQLAKGTSYPQLQGPGTCTGTMDGMPVPDCGLYVKQ